MSTVVPPFTLVDLADMSKKLSVAEMRKMVAERSKKLGAGNKR